MARYAENGKVGSAVASVAGVLAMLAMASAAAAVTVDGRIEPGEYLTGYELSFQVEKAGIVDGGQLWLHWDPGTVEVPPYLVVAFTLPKTLVDNTYGDNSIGWGKGVAPSGKNHNFKDLLGSDKAQFTFTDGAGNTVLDVVVDYMSEVSKGSGTYASLGVTGGDGDVLPGSAAADVLGWGTSLDYNFNTLGFVLTEDSPATDAAYTENPAFAGWVWDVAYELQVTGSLFANNGFGGVTVPIVHASPNKIGRNRVWPEIGPPIPEPVTLVSLLGGVGALVGYVRRRRAA